MTLPNQVSLVANQNSSLAQNQSGVPRPGAEFIEGDGKTIRRDWWRYLNNLTAAPMKEQAMTLPASPANWQAPGNGTVLISGGSGVSLTLTRLGTYTVPVGLIPLRTGDILTITYSGVPTATWFPS